MQRPGPWSTENAVALQDSDEERFQGKAPLLKDADGVRDAVAKLNQGAIQIGGNYCVVYSQSTACYYALFRPPLTKEEALKRLNINGIMSRHGSFSSAVQNLDSDEEAIEINVNDAELVRIFQTLRSKQDLYVSLLWIRGQDVYDVGNTQIRRDCGMTARWKDSFQLHSCEGLLQLYVYAKNSVFSDEVCGVAALSLDRAKAVIARGQSQDEVLELRRGQTQEKDGEKTGELNVTLRRGGTATHFVDEQKMNNWQYSSNWLNDPRELDAVAHRIFSVLAVAHGENKCLQLENLVDVKQAWASEIAEPLDRFADIQNVEDWFWRYNDSETKSLNETQAILMMKGMLMRARDMMSPKNMPKIGVEFKNVQVSYEKGRYLGHGGQATVHIATQKTTGREVVLKQYAKGGANSQSPEEITNEFNLLCQLKHPKISRYYEVFQDAHNFYIATEPYFGGDLTGLPKKAHAAGVVVTETWLAKIIQQIAEGVGFLHCQNIVHCDLKEPNVMVAGKEDLNEPHVVLIDFGLANTLSVTSQKCGTPGYMPPEVWEKSLWTPRGDVFSLGCMVYTLFTGHNPFIVPEAPRDDLQIVEAMTKESNPPSVNSPHSDVRELVNNMLRKDLRERPPIKTVLESRWLTEVSASRDAKIDLSALERLAHNTHQTKFRKALLLEAASRENFSQLKELNDLFVAMDKNNTGSLSVDDVQSVLEQKGWESQYIHKLLDCLVGSDGKISYDGFMGNLMVDEEGTLLDRIFREADHASKGYLDVKDIEQLLERPAIKKLLGRRDADKLLKAMDSNGDGQISQEEFKAVLHGLQPETADIENSSKSMGKSGQPLHSLFMSHRTFSNQRHSYQGYALGQDVEYYSTTNSQWMLAKITHVDPQKGVIVNLKPGCWIQGQVLEEKLRRKVSN